MDLEITENDKEKAQKDENKIIKADQCIFSQPVWEQYRGDMLFRQQEGCLQQYFLSYL